MWSLGGRLPNFHEALTIQITTLQSYRRRRLDRRLGVRASSPDFHVVIGRGRPNSRVMNRVAEGENNTIFLFVEGD